jgi:hypothetical protein
MYAENRSNTNIIHVTDVSRTLKYNAAENSWLWERTWNDAVCEKNRSDSYLISLLVKFVINLRKIFQFKQSRIQVRLANYRVLNYRVKILLGCRMNNRINNSKIVRVLSYWSTTQCGVWESACIGTSVNELSDLHSFDFTPRGKNPCSYWVGAEWVPETV